MAEFIELKNECGTEVTLCTVGASICDLKTMDRMGRIQSIVLTPLNRSLYAGSDSFFGKTIGRTGGRIAGNHFTLNGVEYTVNSKDPNGLHGGVDTLAYKEFTPVVTENPEYKECRFTYLSKHMESGYPGNAEVTVTYRLYKKENKLELCYHVTSDRDTLMNLSNHAYFNMSGNAARKNYNQTLFLDASRMERIEKLLPREIIPCGKIYSFKEPHKIGDYLFEPEIINNANGYDFPYILDKTPGSPDIRLSDEVSGRVMEIRTTYPVVVVYTCNYCEDIVINNGKKLAPYDAVCLECMYHPNTINSDFLPEKKDVLRKGEVYDETITYSFGILE